MSENNRYDVFLKNIIFDLHEWKVFIDYCKRNMSGKMGKWVNPTLMTNKKEMNNAIKDREVTESNKSEHQDRDICRQTSSSSSGDSDEKSRQEKEEWLKENPDHYE